MNSVGRLDHIAFAVPSVPDQVARFIAMGLTVAQQVDGYALVVDPASGFKIELNQEPGEARFRHLGFQSDDVDAGHEELVAEGVSSTEPPHRREFARMRTAFLKDANGLEYQLVDYDSSERAALPSLIVARPRGWWSG